MDINLEQIRKLTIISLFSDDDLMDILVLKGGNALEIAYSMLSRASRDVDVSMSGDFEEFGLTLKEVQEKIEIALMNTFQENGYHSFDVKFEKRPGNVRPGMMDWGGYQVKFKVISTEKFKQLGEDETAARTQSLPLDGDKREMKIDISKYEYCDPHVERELDGYLIKVYTPKMIVFEKLRAICQQMEEYNHAINISNRRCKPRPRDFYDIYTILESGIVGPLDFNNQENKEMLHNFFEIKKAPLMLLNKIKETKDFHEQEFPALKQTVKAQDNLQEFDFYFDYVVKFVEEIIEKLNITAA